MMIRANRIHDRKDSIKGIVGLGFTPIVLFLDNGVHHSVHPLVHDNTFDYGHIDVVYDLV